MDDRMRLLLIEAADPAHRGSMNAYAEVLASAIGDWFQVERLNLLHIYRSGGTWPRPIKLRLRSLRIIVEAARRLLDDQRVVGATDVEDKLGLVQVDLDVARELGVEVLDLPHKLLVDVVTALRYARGFLTVDLPDGGITR